MKVCILYNKVREKDKPDRYGVREEVEAVRESLKFLKIKSFVLEIDEDYKWINILKKKKVDVVINLCEDFGGNPEGEGYIASFLELLKIPYTGSPPFSLFLCLDKMKAKDIVSKNGILTPEYFLPSDFPTSSPIGYPVIIKPNKVDASLGISSKNVVFNEKSYKNILRKLRKNFEFIFAERFIDGREFNVSIFDDKVIGIGEVIFKIKPRIVTYKAKWEKGSKEDKGTETVCPANLNKEDEEKIKYLSLKIFKLLNMRDYGRIDFRMDKGGKIYFLEANPNPDISKNSGFYKALKYSKISYEFFVKRLIERAIERSS